jgi:hypothetical protein
MPEIRRSGLSDITADKMWSKCKHIKINFRISPWLLLCKRTAGKEAFVTKTIHIIYEYAVIFKFSSWKLSWKALHDALKSLWL